MVENMSQCVVILTNCLKIQVSQKSESEFISIQILQPVLKLMALDLTTFVHAKYDE